MAEAALLSQVEGLLEQFIEDYPESASRVEGILSEVQGTMQEFRAGSSESAPEESEEPEVESPEDVGEEEGGFRNFRDAKKAAMKTAKRTGNFQGVEEEPEKDSEAEEEKRKKKSKAY